MQSCSLTSGASAALSRASGGRRLTGPDRTVPSRQSISEPTLKNPQQRQLWDTWRNTWMLAWERQKRLQDKHNYAKELDSLRNFDFDEWRKRVCTVWPCFNGAFYEKIL